MSYYTFSTKMLLMFGERYLVNSLACLVCVKEGSFEMNFYSDVVEIYRITLQLDSKKLVRL